MKMQKLPFRCVFFMLLFPLFLNAETLNYSFKQFFPGRSWPIVAKSFENGSVALDSEVFVKVPPALRIDSGKTNERIVSITFYLVRDILEKFKGKTVVFRGLINRISGTAKPNILVRINQKTETGSSELLFSKNTTVEIVESNKWQEISMLCAIPAKEEINQVNFQIYVENTSKPSVFVIDECVIEETSIQQQKKESSMLPQFTDDRKLEIVKDGKPVAVIIIEKNPTPVVQYSVEELNEHFFLSTGCKLKVLTDNPEGLPAIHIGKTELTEKLGLSPDFLPPDTWLIRKVGQNLIISGGDNNLGIHPLGKDLVPFGTLFATYEFLERVLGARWYWPGESGLVIEKKTDVVIEKVSWHGKPSYQTRFAFAAIPEDKDFSEKDARIWWRRMRWGGTDGNPVGMHSFAHWNKKFGLSHPEWFALQSNGKRLNNPDATGNEAGHLCYTNPEVISEVVSEIRQRFDSSPGLKYATVMPGDSNGIYYCRCPNCQALVQYDKPSSGTHSLAIWTFVNKVAAEILKTHPDRYISCCAYAEYRDIPDNVFFQPNVCVTYCVPMKPEIWHSEYKKNYLSGLKAWSKKVKNIYVWDYWLQRWYPGLYGAPAIFPHILQDIYLLDYGIIKGRVIELVNKDTSGALKPHWQNWLYDHLNVYIGFRLLWNIETDVDKTIEEFYKLFYGPAAPLIQKFYQEMEKAYLNPETKGPDFSWNWDTCWNQTYTRSFVQNVMGYLQQAEIISRGHETYHKRVIKLLQGFLPFEEASKRYSTADRNISVKEKVILPLFTDKPVIDGLLTDNCWKNAVKLEEFVTLHNSKNIRAKTEFFLGYDVNNIYVAAICHFSDKELKLPVQENTVDGNVWTGESCEIFIAPDEKQYFQFMIGPGNVYADGFVPDVTKPAKDFLTWNCREVVYKTAVADKKWTFEIQIPLQSINREALKNGFLGNFCRNHYYFSDEESRTKKIWSWEPSLWRPTFSSFNNTRLFSRIFFTP